MALTFSWIFSFYIAFASTSALVGSTTMLFSPPKVIDLTNNSKKPLNESTDERSSMDKVEECYNNMTSYMYKGAFCDDPDVKNFFQESPREGYTCAQRCGIAPKIGTLQECACDEICIVYGDCCKDFLSVCPEVHARGRVVYSHLTGVSVRCEDERLTVVNDDNQATPSSTKMASTTFSTSPTFSFPDDQTSDWFQNDKIELDFLSFKVVDTANGVLFNNYASFNSLKILTSKPIFIPKVARLFCQALPEGIDSKQMSTKFSQILPRCSTVDFTDAELWPHRKCYNSLHKVSCNCKKRSHVIQTNLYEICLGKYNNYTLESMETITNLENDNDKEYGFTKGQCTLGFSGLDPIEDKAVALGGKISIGMTFFPVFKSVDQTNNTLVLTHENYKEYVIEMTKTVEKRFRCPKSNKLFSECQLEECVMGALVWTNPHPQPKREFKEDKCFLPILATVEAVGHPHGIPLCTCLSVSRAMVALQTWKVKTNLTNSHVCILRLQRISGGKNFYIQGINDLFHR